MTADDFNHPTCSCTAMSFTDDPIELSECLIPIETAQPGDLVGLIGSCFDDDRLIDGFRTEGFGIMTQHGPTRRGFADLSGETADRAARTIGRGILQNKPLLTTSSQNGGAKRWRHVRLMFFADAVLSVGSDWLHRDADCAVAAIAPEVRMRAAPDLLAANELRWKMLRYFNIFRKMEFPEQYYPYGWDLRTPDLACLLNHDARLRFGCVKAADLLDD